MNFEPPVPTEWSRQDEESLCHLLRELDRMLVRADGRMSATGALIGEMLAEICNPLLTPNPLPSPKTSLATPWRPYRDGEKKLSEFFAEWAKFVPNPKNPSEYIERWDELANTKAGLELINGDQRFKNWFVRFLDLHGRFLNSTSSTTTIEKWMQYKGTTEHPFNINDYEVPKGGFRSFNQFFLRSVKPGNRPLCPKADKDGVVVAPCDGGVFYLTRGELIGNAYELPGKSQDTFQLEQALPGYGAAFLGGPLLDILLWFTDYHHFHAPVTGTVVHQGQYDGLYNYDFNNFDADDPYTPMLSSGSDRVGWYEDLGKHKRYVWIIRTEDLGLVAMVAIGFWGVGSIQNAVAEGDRIEKGQSMGHFGYGGSSIVLAFEPNMGMQFAVGNQPIGDPDTPVLMKVRECLGRRTKPLSWS